MKSIYPCFRVAALFLASIAVSSGQVPSSWQSRGVGAGGALYSPSINPANDSEYYVASDMSELYHTTNFGNAYTIVNAAQVQGGHESGVRFTSNPLIAYTVTYTGGNNAMPAKTVDGGTTWSILSGNPIPDDDVYSLWTDYDNPTRVVLAGYSDLYFSSNGGTTFSPINVTVNTDNGVLICGVFFDGNNIYLGTNAGLLVSTNGGATFTNAGTPGIPAGELMLSFTGAKVSGQTKFFCLTANSSYPGIDLGSDYYANYRGIYSLDNGTGNWTAHSTGITQSTDFLLSVAMARNDLNTVYAAGGSDAGVPVVFKTTNGGGNWTNTFHAANNQNINTGWSGTGGDRGWGYGEVVFGLAVAPGNSSRAIFTDYGFVHRTSDGGSTWQQAYVNVNDQHPVNTTAIAGASYHSVGLEDTSAWQVTWADAQHLFAGFSDIKGVRSSDGGVTWSLNYTGHSANSMYRMATQPTTGAIYAATSDIHDMYQSTRLADSPLNNADANGKIIVSTNQGAAWQTVHNFGHPVFWLCFDPNNSNRLYASVVHSTAGGIFVTNDLQNGAASTWTKLTNPPRTEGHPATIVVLNDGKVVCTYSGHRAPGFTASSGVFVYDPSTQAWSDVSDAGMRYWTKDIVIDPADSTQNTWYVGVFSGWGGPPNGLGGLYRTTDRGAHWTRVNALDRVMSVAFNPAVSGQAYLTTETDGLWSTANIRAASPVFTRVANYPFRQPERVFFNPFKAGETWITSFGNGLMVGSVDNLPVMVTSPSSQSIGVGGSVTFQSLATSNPSPSYQWQKNGVSIAGATSASYTIAAVAVGDAGNYTVVASNSAGSVTSSVAILTVTVAPKNAASYNSTTFPASAAAGATINFTSSVTNTGSQAWGANHYLALRDSTLTNLAFASLNGVAVGGSNTASFSLVAPSVAGTYTYYIQGVEAGVEFFSTKATLTLTVTATPKNAASYDATTFPASATSGATINFTYSVTNTGSQAWGANHYLALRDSAQNNLAFASLSGVAIGASKTSNFTLVAPTTAGTYTYYIQGVEAGVEFFSTRATLTLTVTGAPKNAASYNSINFPASAAVGTTINFTYSVTNTGSQAWGANHYLALRDATQTNLAFASLSGVAIGASKTSSFTLVAPSVAGTYTYYVQGVEAGVEFFSTRATLTLTVTGTPKNAMSYQTTTFPTTVTAGTAVHFSYHVTNTGTQAWGAQHYLSLRDGTGTYLEFIPISGVAVNGGITVNLDFTAPSTAGTYTYYAQGVENGVEFFGTQATLTLVVPSTPLANAMRYNATTFPASAAAGSTVNFTYNVTNTGTHAWGAQHYVSLRNSAGTYLAFAPVNGIAIGASTTVSLSLVAPATSGTYTYYVEGVENGVEFFSTTATIILAVP